jgi:hypothetical protein
MYSAKAGSPKTTLAADLAANATSMTLDDVSVLPAAPNLAVLGDDSNAEVVSYTTISDNVVSGLIRGLGGTTASVWPSGTDVARNYTSFDHDRFISNIVSLESTKQNVLTFDQTPTTGSTNPVTSGGIATAITTSLATKANIASPAFTGTPTAPTPTTGDSSTKIATTAYVQEELGDYAPLASPAFTGTPTAPTAATSTNTTQIATCAFVKKNGVYYAQGTLRPGTTQTFTNADITADMRVIDCQFFAPQYVSSELTWTTAAGSITFSGTFTASCTIYFILATPTTLTLSS